MKQVHLVTIILACSLLALPSAFSGQHQKDGNAPSDGVGYTRQDAFVLSGVPCGTPQFTAYERPTGKCSCEIITGARVRGCTGTTQLECEAQTCTYERINVFTGEVTETGNMECAWTEGYPS